MIQNPKIGDKVWVFDVNHDNPKKRIIREIEIMQVTTTEAKDKKTTVGLKSEYWHGENDQQYHYFNREECFLTLDALLDDFRSRAIFLPKE